jgi:hypothetical protein
MGQLRIVFRGKFNPLPFFKFTDQFLGLVLLLYLPLHLRPRPISQVVGSLAALPTT